ncbi:uncharacterized protein LOC120348538 isoform X2 [Styela clava]|uniref:uncharacterized protein LOC120348538 isoform X3 n=1 Tax=Styela clava TaxID=7725 RepID=UPI001939C00B|nr:uncharacterized protein LOC120348538 isoform X3 [Styela clava]
MEDRARSAYFARHRPTISGGAMIPITPRLVTWNVNNERPNVYFPNINRSYISDLTYVPGHFINRRTHKNSVNREASWSPYTTEKREVLIEAPAVTEELESELSDRGDALTDSVHHPELKIARPLGLLKREYKHPLSMYEHALNGTFSRYSRHVQSSGGPDPIIPRQYYRKNAPYGVYLYAERPQTAGKDWVMNRWRMWSGGSSSSPQ